MGTRMSIHPSILDALETPSSTEPDRSKETQINQMKPDTPDTRNHARIRRDARSIERSRDDGVRHSTTGDGRARGERDGDDGGDVAGDGERAVGTTREGARGDDDDARGTGIAREHRLGTLGTRRRETGGGEAG